MDKYLAPPNPPQPTPKSLRRQGWKRSLIEVDGKLDPIYNRANLSLLVQSYCEVGEFPHWYHINGKSCPTFLNLRFASGLLEFSPKFRRNGIASLDFDTKGTYLASVTKPGCLTVHDFDSLYCQSHFRLKSMQEEDEGKHMLHLSRHEQLDFVKWNPSNQDEVACSSMKSNDVDIFDISYISSEPIEVLRKRNTVTVHGFDTRKGISDIAFRSHDKSSVLASDVHGIVNIWDRRTSNLPCLELISNPRSTINSIKLHADNQLVFGADKLGIVHIWDIRGGRSSSQSNSYSGVDHHPVKSLKISSLLERIGSLKAQSNIVPMEIHSIDFNPSCSFQLAFHLDDGWSGILNLHDLQVTHIHCPPPAWLSSSGINWTRGGSLISAELTFLRKPSWLAESSIYAIGSSSTEGIYLLDFNPDPNSPCHVNYDEDDVIRKSGGNNRFRENKFVQLSERVTACATHPLNNTIVVGTKENSLLLISQRHHSDEASEDVQGLRQP